MGFKLYGFDAEAAQVAQDVSVAASHFLLNQVQELYTAAERSEANFPVKPGRAARTAHDQKCEQFKRSTLL
jgi:hypothetical protein